MKRSKSSKRDDPNYVQMSGYVRRDIAVRFRQLCAGRDLSQSEGVEMALEEWTNQKAHQDLPDTIAALVQQNYQKLKDHKIKNLDAIATGEKPSPSDVLLISAALQIDSIALHHIYLQSFPECANGTAKSN